MKDSVSSLFPEKGRGVAIFGSLMCEEEGMGAAWSWASSSGDGVVVVDIGVKVGERDCGERVEG